MTLNLIVAVLAAIGYLIFIFYTRKSNNFETYSVASRSIGFFLIFASMCANYIGPGMTMGLTNEGFTSGYFYIAIAGFYGLGKIFEGLVFAPLIRRKFTNAFTLGDVIGGKDSHNNKIVQLVAGIISFGLVVGFCVIMAKAGGDILNTFIGLPPFVGTVIVTIIVMAYSIFGGIKSSMQTDFLQFCMFMFLLPLLGLLAGLSKDFDWSSFSSNAVSLTKSGFQKTTGVEMFGLMITWFFGEMLVPPTVQTILSSESSKTSKKALVYSGAMMIFWLFLMLTLGVLSKTTLTGIASDDKVLLHLGEKFYVPGLFGLFTVAMVGVVMSSQDALINGASVIFTRDIWHILKPLDDKQSLKYSRIAGLFVGVLSIFLAVYIPSVIQGLLFFYSIWVPTILTVAVFSIFLKNHSWIAALSAMLVGITTAIIWNVSEISKTVPTIIAGLVASLTVYLAIHFLTINKVKRTISN